MPFLGKQPTAGFASIVKDDLTADGSTTAFTLSKQVANANDIAVFVGNVRQEPTDAYTVNGTTLTMSAAPASGVNFYVLHIAGTVESSVVPADGSITSAKLAPGAVSTSFATLTDTTVSASDPTTTSNKTPVGHVWVNSTSGESYVLTDATNNANVWFNIGGGSGNIQNYNIETLVIAGGAGGGGGASGGGGGGGAGGYVSETLSNISSGTVLTVTVGAGGSGGAVNSRGSNGGNSSVTGGTVAIGGGGGGYSNAAQGVTGGSGGGGGGNANSQNGGAAGTSGQGNAGGNEAGTGADAAGGGGGGAGQVGGNASVDNAGEGGNGSSSSITGSAITRAGGGGGGAFTGSAGGAGAGGGANGGSSSHATANTGGGGGGGGAGNGADHPGGNGGTGVVILSLPTANYSGTTTGSPVVTTSGSNTILQFNSSGSYTA